MRRAFDGGFTLLELTVALVLMALMAAVLYGSISLSSDSWNRGEASAERTAQMRLAEEFMRKTLGQQYPLRLHKLLDQPLYFAGASDSIAYVAALPGRAGGGLYYFRLARATDGDNPRLTLQRVVPGYGATAVPDFSGADVSALADGIAEIKLGYFGRDAGSVTDAILPTWRDRWDDPQLLPLLIRIDIKPVKGAPWPTLVVEPRLSPEAGCTDWDASAHHCSQT